MNTNANQPCGHGACACSVPAGQEYCSDPCRQAMEEPHAGTDGERCPCGHPACASASPGKKPR